MMSTKEAIQLLKTAIDDGDFTVLGGDLAEGNVGQDTMVSHLSSNNHRLKL